MTEHSLTDHARWIWAGLAGVPVAFSQSGGVRVVVAPESAFCPPGWVGIVVLGDAALVTAPTQQVADVVERRLSRLPTGELANAAMSSSVLPLSETLGPATLAYLTAQDFRADSGAEAVTRIAADHEDLRVLAGAAGAEDAGEAGLEGMDSPAFVIREGDIVLAAAGYRRWPAGTAHLCLLTHPRHRGRGLARTVASAAVAHALADGLTPQWRARPMASRRVAAALGFREVGAQLSVRLAADT